MATDDADLDEVFLGPPACITPKSRLEEFARVWAERQRREQPRARRAGAEN